MPKINAEMVSNPNDELKVSGLTCGLVDTKNRVRDKSKILKKTYTICQSSIKESEAKTSSYRRIIVIILKSYIKFTHL